MQPLLSLIVPTYNEVETIQHLLKTLPLFLYIQKIPFEIIIIDDNSPDKTAKIVKAYLNDKRIKLFIRENKQGIGSAIIYGFHQASGDILIPLMADGADSYNDICILYKTMCEKNYDVLFTNRFRNAGLDYPFFKRICNRCLNLFVAKLYNYPYTDLTNAFKAYHRRMLPFMRITTTGFETLLELPLLCLFAGTKYGEISVSWSERKKGISKLPLFKAGAQYLLIALKYLPDRYLHHSNSSQSISVE